MKLDKDEIKEQLTLDLVMSIVDDLGGEPMLTDFGFISSTICHNHPHEGSRKLYYYENTKLFRCYTGCDSTFDIFELITKIFGDTLYSAMLWVVHYCGWTVDFDQEADNFGVVDWKALENYPQQTHSIRKTSDIPIIDKNILNNFHYPRIMLWEREGISREVISAHKIGYYPPTEQIVIPHYNDDGELIGIRGRALCKEYAEMFGKYRPLIANMTQYNHPLGLNLYNLDNAKENIRKMKTAIVFEGEKSALKYATWFDTDISVACCGSSLSAQQVDLLLKHGAENIIIAFDRQFQEIGDEEFKHLTKNLSNINTKFGKLANFSFIFDKNKLTNYKDAPVDQTKEVFLQLYKERVVLN